MLFYFHRDWRNALKFRKIFKNPSMKKTGPRYGLKFVSSDNPGKNISQKVKKCSKFWQELKNVISNFAWFFTDIINVMILEEEWALPCVSTLIWQFSNFSQFAKIPSLKSFGRLWSNSCTKVVILCIRYHFTCGDSDLG